MGLSARTAAQALSAALDGTVAEEDPHAFLVRNTRLGDLTVELDIRYAHPQRAYGKTLPLRLGPRTAAWLGSALSRIVPRELITAPMALDRLPDVDQAIDVLRRACEFRRSRPGIPRRSRPVFRFEAGHLDGCSRVDGDGPFDRSGGQAGMGCCVVERRLRRLSPVSSMRYALCKRRSRMASAMVGFSSTAGCPHC